MNKRFNTFLVLLLCISLTIQLLQSSAFGETTEQEKHYADLNGHWAEKTIREMIAKGYIKGELSEGIILIHPDRQITRAEFVAVMTNVKSYETIAGNVVRFNDVEPGSWYYDAIEKASSNGLVHGYLDGSFGPGRFITRAEAAAVITNSEKLNSINNQINEAELKFSDTDKSSWYYNSVILCRLFGIINGYPDGSFRPQNNITRAEAFVMINNSLNKKEIETPKPAATPTPAASTIEEPDDDIPDSSAGSSGVSIISKRPKNDTQPSTKSPSPKPIQTPTPTATQKPSVPPTAKPTQKPLQSPTPKPTSTPTPKPASPPPSDEGRVVNLTGFEILNNSVLLSVNEEYTLMTDFEPFAATNKEVIWSSEDPSIASVDMNGKITGISEGTTKITGRTLDGNFKDSCIVTVETDEIVIESIDVDKQMLEPDETANISILAYSKINSSLNFDVEAKKGTVTSSVYSSVYESFYKSLYSFSWKAPDIQGVYSLNITITDEQEKSLERELEFSVGLYYDSIDWDEHLPPLQDFDNDGLSNMEELALGTNPRSKDTDEDGINDYDEINIYKTSPVKKDSDGDETDDGAEIMLGTNPLVPDEHQTFEISKRYGSAGIVILGYGNNVLSDFGKSGNKLFYSYKGLVGNPYELDTPESIQSARISIGYNRSELEKYGIEEKDLKIYSYRYETGKIEKMSDIHIDKENSCVTAKTGPVGSGKTVFLMGTDALADSEMGSFSIVFALDMSENMKDIDEECMWKESLINLVDIVSKDSRMSVIQSVYNNISNNVELVEEMTADKIIIRYGIEDLGFKPSPGHINPSNMFDRAFDILLSEDGNNGRIVFAVLADCTDEEYGILAEKLAFAKANNISVNIITTSRNSEATERMKRLAEIGKGHFISIPSQNVTALCISDTVRDIKELNNKVNMSNPESIVASNSINALYRAFAAAASALNTAPLVAINGFDFSKHTFTIPNKSKNIYTTHANCAGMVMCAQLSFLGLLPSFVELSDRDRKLDEDHDSFNYGNADTAYNLLPGLEFESILDKNISVLRKTPEVNKMFDYWWIRANFDIDSYITKSSVLLDNYLSTRIVNAMCSLIDSGCPIYYSIGNSYDTGNKKSLVLPEIKGHYHAIMGYNYQKTYDDSELCKVEIGIYDANWPGDSGRKLILTRNKNIFGKYKDEWEYEYVFENPDSIYTSNDDFQNRNVTKRKIEFFDMALYKELLAKYFSDDQKCKVKFNEDYKGTELVIKLPKDKVDDLMVYDKVDSQKAIIVYEADNTGDFKKSEVQSGDFTQITLKSDKYYNQLVVAIGSEFVENEIYYNGNKYLVNMQDIYPDVFKSPYTNFPDIGKHHWCAQEIKAMKSEGIVSGYPDGLFHPNRTITRAEFIKIVLGAFGIYQNQADYYKAKQYYEKYKDLKNHWAGDLCALVLAEGWYAPDNESLFEPDKPITREECADILWKVITSSRAKNVRSLVKNDISTTRYIDNANIDNKYVSSVAHLDINKIMTGYANNVFSPKNNITRAEVCKIVFNALIK